MVVVRADGTAPGDDAHLQVLALLPLEVDRQGSEVGQDACAAAGADAAVLGLDVEHERQRALGGKAVRGDELARLGEHGLRGLGMDELALRPPAEGRKEAPPRLVDAVPRPLDAARPRQLLVEGGSQSRAQGGRVVVQHLVEKAGVLGVQSLEQRLEAALSQVPLQDAEGDALAVEVSREAGEAVRGRSVGLEAAGEGEAAVLERRARESRGGDGDSREEARPGAGLHSAVAVDVEVLGALEGAHGALGAAAEDAVEWAVVVAELGQAALDQHHLRAEGAQLVDHGLPLAHSTDDLRRWLPRTIRQPPGGRSGAPHPH